MATSIRLAAGLVVLAAACGPRQPADPYPLPVLHEDALPAPAAERAGGARRSQSVRHPPPPATRAEAEQLTPAEHRRGTPLHETLVRPTEARPAAARTAAMRVGTVSPVRTASLRGSNDLRLEVRIGERVLDVHRHGEQIRRYDIAVGQPEHPTPTGEFEIHQIDWNPDWTPPDSDWADDRDYKSPGEDGNPMGRVRLIYQAPYSIHGTTDLASLGGAESHGSIRMANEDIIELATLVMEAGGEVRSEAWYEEVLANPTVMVTIHLSNPVPLVNRQ
jgi:lipoprotein-anchoring transpeptidase ErfK/SrfK